MFQTSLEVISIKSINIHKIIGLKVVGVAANGAYLGELNKSDESLFGI
jgi:hypothetical protein